MHGGSPITGSAGLGLRLETRDGIPGVWTRRKKGIGVRFMRCRVTPGKIRGRRSFPRDVEFARALLPGDGKVIVMRG